MQPSFICLQPDELKKFIAGDMAPMRVDEVEDHLSTCEVCRGSLEATVGDCDWWQDLESALRSDNTDCEHETTESRESVCQRLTALLGPTDDPSMLGRIGAYEIIGLLGYGGMGAVFKGFDRSLNRFVAIKMLLPHLAASGAARKRFAREGQAVAAVVDDHVMAIHCVDEWQGVPYLVMTYSRGVSLQKRLSDNGPLEVREILRIGMQAAKGLAAAHAQGIVHRDIKPANIFLDQSVERVQLMDFGLARAVDDASLTRSGTLAGTPQYMSPEQARAETVDHRSDLFSLGSVMYAMCTGHAPFRADSSYSVLRLITDKEPRPIREITPEIPNWLCAVISKLMAKQASERYQSAKEVSELLEECLAHMQQPATMPLPEAVAALAPIMSRRPPIGKLIAAAAFAFALLFAGVFMVLELNKGTLTIQSDSDDVRVRITSGDEVVDELKVSKSGQSVRVAAGKYTVEIIGETDELTVENGQVMLHRAGTEVIRIVHNARNQTENQTSFAPDAGPGRTTSNSLLDKLQGRWHVVEHYYLGGNPKRRLCSAIVRGNRVEISPGYGPRPLKIDLIIGELGPPQQIDLKFANNELERQEMLENGGGINEPPAEPVLNGIIEVEGDLVSICMSNSSDSPHRPIAFISGEEQILWNFTRAAEHEATFERALNQRKYEDVGQAKKSPSLRKRTISLESPFQGHVRWGNGIRENVFLQEGDVIAEVIGFDPEVHRQLNGQLSLLKQKAEAEATLVQASEESLKVYRANVEALESRLKVYEQGQTNEEKRQVDVDRDKDALSKAKAKEVEVESDLNKARFDLNVTQKEVADLETKLTEQKHSVVHAPSSGYVTDLCLKELLKKGDVICLFEPESENSPPTKPIANGESDKAEQGVGTLMTDSNDKTHNESILHNTIGPPRTKYFLTLKFYEKRNGSIKHLYSPTIAVVDGKKFEYTNAGTIKESFSGYKVNGVISKFHNDVTFLALLQVVNYSGKFQANANLPISETRTVQLDEVTWLDVRIEPDQTDNAPKLSATLSLDHSKVISELPVNWTDFLALLPETGTALVMLSDQPEIRKQMSPIAKKVANGASIQFIEIQQTASRAKDSDANHIPSTHYLLMKDRQVVNTRYGLLTEEKLLEFVAEAKDWLTPHSAGVEENSLVRVDCYIFPGAGNIGTQSGEAFPITAAVIAVHEDQALLLGPDSVAEYMEKGYACVAIVRDAAGKQKQLPLEVLLNGPVKLLGCNGEPHKRQASVRVTHSDGTATELPITSILPDPDLLPTALEEYDVDSAIYRIRGFHGLKPVKLAAIEEAITVGERVLSGGFSQKPIVPLVLGFSPPMQWQTQKAVSIDGVLGNMHGPETFDVLCPSLPVPSGFTFNEHGRLIGKYALGSPTHENMKHGVFKSHSIHSILHAVLDKIDDAGLKATLLRTLE